MCVTMLAPSCVQLSNYIEHCFCQTMKVFGFFFQFEIIFGLTFGFNNQLSLFY